MEKEKKKMGQARRRFWKRSEEGKAVTFKAQVCVSVSVSVCV
jgi:hypothetical protein